MVQVTASAKHHFESLLEKFGPEYGVIISVLNKGCSGLKYDVAVKKIEPTWHPIDRSQDRIFCHHDSLNLLKKVTVDLQKLSLGQTKVVFLNPSAGNVCGCGESFNLKDNNE